MRGWMGLLLSATLAFAAGAASAAPGDKPAYCQTDPAAACEARWQAYQSDDTHATESRDQFVGRCLRRCDKGWTPDTGAVVLAAFLAGFVTYEATQNGNGDHPASP